MLSGNRADIFTHLQRRLPGALCAVLIVVAYFVRLGTNPFGTFCDEALIGLKANQGWKVLRSEGLFYEHFGTVAGSLPVLSTAPFVHVLGLNDFSLRLTSVVFTLATASVIYLSLRRSHVAYPWFGALVFLFVPVTIHLGRINFGHAPSIFAIALGVLLYLKGRDQHKPWPTAMGGLSIAGAAYGYPGFFVATPIFFMLLVASEIPWFRLNRSSTMSLGSAMLGFAVGYAPIIVEAITNPMFMERFRQKDQMHSTILSIDRLTNAIANYPKYYRLDYLFVSGELGQDGSFILRHSVKGAGLLPWVCLPLLVAAGWRLWREPDKSSIRNFYPFLLLALAAPIPDLVTTDPSIPPYTFSLATGLLCIPYLSALGLDTINRMANDARRKYAGMFPTLKHADLVVTRILVVWLIASTSVFVFSTYPNYAWSASGYMGWQSGPRDMVAFFDDHQAEYQSMMVEGKFNQTSTLIAFYEDDPTLRKRISVGTPEPTKPVPTTVLHVVSASTYEARFENDLWIVVNTLTYPNNDISFYMIVWNGE